MLHRSMVAAAGIVCAVLTAGTGLAGYTNFEVSHVHPIALTPSGGRLLAVNTPDARLEVLGVATDGRLSRHSSIPVGLEPVTVRARTDSEAWVVNNLSDSISIVNLDLGTTVRTLFPGNEPTDVVFAAGRAFVAVSEEDAVKVYSLANLDAAPIRVDLFGRDVRALAVSLDGNKVYAVVLKSGNRTTGIEAGVIFPGGLGFNAARLAALGLNPPACDGPHPAYPPLPSGITRNPTLIDPPDGIPPVGLIVRWNEAAGEWQDDAGQNWTNCLPFRMPDHDLFIIDAADPTGVPQVRVDHLGTSLFDVSVRPGTGPGSGRIYVPHTEARNHVRFEHPLGVQGHMVDNRMAVVDPASVPANRVTLIDLNTHIDRASDPATNLAERRASVSQPGMMVWKSDGSVAYLTAIGSRKVFRLQGNCLAGSCLFGPTRATPDAVEAGEGPTGVALHEASNRLYVLNRFANSIAIVNTSTMSRLGELALHDPSPATIKTGRRLLYDGIDGSRHGDAACSSCHLSGDTDGLAWDLGDPTGDFVPYSTPLDNVRFLLPGIEAHDGFDPQKGPMTTQTLRAMLEPLHWRGDRNTMRAFNAAFVGLMGKENIGTSAEPKGLSDADMDLFRDFALDIRMPPNPFRNVDDTLPNFPVRPHGSPFAGNPANGRLLFDTLPSDGVPCVGCHQDPFGAAGGALGGVEPQEPTSAAATALFNGTADGSLHSDLEIPHLRNMHEKFGPTFGPAGGPFPDSKTGFGFTHDGSIPDLGTFLSASVFNVTAAQARDIATFVFFFPSGTRPSVGRQVTVPQGTPPTGTPGQEGLLTTLIGLGDLAVGTRHCELTASALSGGRMRSWFLSAGTWTTDVAGEPPVSTAALRQSADGPVSFLCVPIGSGVRLGTDRDEDTHFNGSDCAPADPTAWQTPGPVTGVTVTLDSPATLTWDAQASLDAEPLTYEVAGGTLSSLGTVGLSGAGCLDGGLGAPSFVDARPDPSPGEGFYYLIQARKACAAGGYGPGRETLDGLVCAGP